MAADERSAGAEEIIRVRDPDNVREAVANGPFNVHDLGPNVEIVFTSVRYDAEALFSNRIELAAVVSARILLNADAIDLLIKTLSDHAAKRRANEIAPSATGSVN